MEERRCAIRWSIALPVRYLGISRHVEGVCRTRDLSTMGAKLEMGERHRQGDKLTIVLDIPEKGKGPVCIEADVVWQRENEELDQECNYMTGVAFRKIRDCHKDCILDYVKDNHPHQLRERWWEGLQ